MAEIKFKGKAIPLKMEDLRVLWCIYLNERSKEKRIIPTGPMFALQREHLVLDMTPGRSDEEHHEFCCTIQGMELIQLFWGILNEPPADAPAELG